MRHLSVWSGLLLITLFIFPGIAIADRTGNLITTDLGFDGYMVPGCRMPLRIELDKKVEGGRIEILRRDPAGNFSCQETFAASNTYLECPILMDEDLESVTVRLTSDRHLLNEVHLDPNTKKFPGHLFLVSNVPAILQHKMAELLQPDEPVLTVPISIRELPLTVFAYEGVSGLVLADPGPVLKPAQIKAFYAWLCGGGRVVIWDLHPWSESILNLIRLPQKTQDGVSSFAIGFGKLILIRGDFWKERMLNVSAAKWQNLLALKPYRKSPRLTLNHCFPSEVTPPQQTPDIRVLLVPITAAWMGLALFFRYRNRINGWQLLILPVFLALVLTPWVNYVAGVWQRGYDIRCRMFILPHGGGILTQATMSGRENTVWELITSPWESEFAFGSHEVGAVRPGNGLEWAHLKPNPEATIQILSVHSFNLIGWLPVETVPPEKSDQNPESNPVADDLYLYHSSGRINRIALKGREKLRSVFKGRILQTELLMNGDSVVKAPPLWLQSEAEWLNRLTVSAPPDTQWLIGRQATLGTGFRFQKKTLFPVIWVAPVFKKDGAGNDTETL